LAHEIGVKVDLIDVSLPIGPDLLTWPGDPAVSVEPRLRISKGDAANVSELSLGTHTGTHVDPPVHFIDGAAAIDVLPLERTIGPCVVVDARGIPGAMHPAELERLDIPAVSERVLFRTDASEFWRRLPVEFPDEYPCISPDGAAWLVDRGVRLVGVDFLSVEQRGAPGHPTHVTLLSNDVVIVEGLDLSRVEPGSYELIALPLRIVDGDGGPARAVLVRGALA
jgi:arylformamidase